MVLTPQSEEALRKAQADVVKTTEEAADERAKLAKRRTEFARKQSEETLAEQSAMVPEPSQEEADLIKVGAADPMKRKGAKQPDGPAARKAAEFEQAALEPEERTMQPAPSASESGYQTRKTK